MGHLESMAYLRLEIHKRKPEWRSSGLEEEGILIMNIKGLLRYSSGLG